MKYESSSIKLDNKLYSATKSDVDEIQIIKEKDVVKKHIVDATLETCDEGMLVEQYKDICDFGSGSGGSEEPQPSLKVSKVLSENSPEVIAAVGNEIAYYGYDSSQVEEKFGWKLGDTTIIPRSTGENIEVRIDGYNHDDLSDGNGKAGITFEMTHLLPTGCKQFESQNNKGGYPASIVRNTHLPSVKSTLPQEWQDIIVKVDKKSADGGASYYTQTKTTSEDLFLLSHIEFFGKAGNAQDGDNEGVQYEYWQGKSNSDRIKMYDSNGDGEPDTKHVWWLRSCMGTANMGLVDDYGKSTSMFANVPFYISFAFCVGAAKDYKA